MNLPEYPDIKIHKTQEGKPEVLDVLRRRYVSLTPEEWVRQHFINFLIKYRGYPAALLANEVELTIGAKHLRCDSVLFDRNKQPRMIIEYKAESVTLTEKAIRQITTYNMLLHVDYLIVSNGNQHICLHLDAAKNQWEYLKDIPNYQEINS